MCLLALSRFARDVPYQADAESQRVSDEVNAYWASFAKTGDPNHAKAPAQWPKFQPTSEDDDLRLQLDPKWGLLNSFRKQECAFWRAGYEAQK